MTFSRAKPAGWTDDIDTITAAQVNQIDTNQSRALDGTAGGTYSPVPPLNINGLTATTIGVFTRGPLAQHPMRFDTTTILDTALAQVLDTQPVDIFYIDTWASGPFANSLDLELGILSPAIAPIRGQVVTIAVPAANGSTIDIKPEGGGVIATIPAAYSLQAAGSPLYAKFIYDGSTWRRLEFSGDVSG
jgi:hypothetical protein